MTKDTEYQEKISQLHLFWLKDNYSKFLSWAKNKKPSYISFLRRIIDEEYDVKMDRSLKARIKRAQIPQEYVIDTFPFKKQKKLDKRKIMTLYDSMDYMSQNQTLLFIGPTGCGKSGLATSFLIHAIHEGFRGRYIDFEKLLSLLARARGSFREEKIMKQFIKFDVLLIDEMGYSPCNEEKAGLFFELIRQRYKNGATIITTQYGFDEWNSFLRNEHLTAAIIDRITCNCALFDMQDCISIRPKNILWY